MLSIIALMITCAVVFAITFAMGVIYGVRTEFDGEWLGLIYMILIACIVAEVVWTVIMLFMIVRWWLLSFA